MKWRWDPHPGRVLEASGARGYPGVGDRGRAPALLGRRKAAFPAVGRITPDYYCMDGTIPRRHLAEMLTAIAALETKHGLRCANVFHAGDGNPPLIMYDAAKPGDWEQADAFGAEILELSVAFGVVDHGRARGRHREDQQMCAQYAT